MIEPERHCPNPRQPVAPAWLGGKAQRNRHRPAGHPCDIRCTSARGILCECTCNGKNHGIDHNPPTAAQEELF